MQQCFGGDRRCVCHHGKKRSGGPEPSQAFSFGEEPGQHRQWYHGRELALDREVVESTTAGTTTPPRSRSWTGMQKSGTGVERLFVEPAMERRGYGQVTTGGTGSGDNP